MLIGYFNGSEGLNDILNCCGIGDCSSVGGRRNKEILTSGIAGDDEIANLPTVSGLLLQIMFTQALRADAMGKT